MSNAASQTENPFATWQARLRGEEPEHVRGRAEPGFWRLRQRDGRLVAIRLWRETGSDKLCMIYDKGEPEYVKDEEAFCERVFAWIIKNPVSQEAYKFYMAEGRWPDQVPDVAAQVKERLGSNAAPDQTIKETVAELLEDARKWLKEIGGEIKTQEHADKAGNYASRFQELAKEAEDNREQEKKPHLKAGRDVDAKWKPVHVAASDAKTWARNLIQPFLKAEQARRAAEVAQQAAKGEAIDTNALKVKAGTRGRAVSLKSTSVLVVTDEKALFTAYVDDERFRNDEAVVSVLRRLAYGDIQIGKDVPGAKIETKQVAQ